MVLQLLAKCPTCSQTLQLELSDADKMKQCQKCARLFHVPDLEHLKKAMEVIDNAKTSVFVDQDGNMYG